MTRARLSLLAVGGLLLPACSVLLDADATQCTVDADCNSLGDGYRCDVDVCVRTDDTNTASTTDASGSGTTESPNPTTEPSTSGPAATTESTDSEDSETPTGSDDTTGGPPDNACPDVSRYEVSDSIAVIRNACELPSQVGSVLTRGQNEAEVAAPFETLPFDICLYGVLAETLWIGDNGYVTVGEQPPAALQSDVGVPHSLGEPGVPAPGVVPFWDAMRPSSSGACVAVEGSEPNRILWVTWDGACFEDGSTTCNEDSGSSLTFSVGFEESTGSILVGYVSMTGDGGLAERAMGQTATTGITNVGPRNCPASECNDQGMCEDGSPCNYTEVASSEIRSLDTVQFDPISGD
jgi:hypothetical protein